MDYEPPYTACPPLAEDPYGRWCERRTPSVHLAEPSTRCVPRFYFSFHSICVGVKALCNRTKEDCNVLEHVKTSPKVTQLKTRKIDKFKLYEKIKI